MAWIPIIVVMALITAWALIRKKVAGLPLVAGLWLLLLTGYLATIWFPPAPRHVLAMGLLGGLSAGLLIWGITNIFIETCIYKTSMKAVEKIRIGDREGFMALEKSEKSHYGVLYGLLPWNDEGAAHFVRFVNEYIWRKGYKISQLQIELEVYGNIRIAWIWGLLEPKHIVDRILY